MISIVLVDTRCVNCIFLELLRKLYVHLRNNSRDKALKCGNAQFPTHFFVRSY